MKHALALACALLLAGPALAQDVAQVLSRTPVFEQVSVPRQVCTPVASTHSSGAGALLGAMAGGAIGHQIGGGSGQALATMAGVVGGALIGQQMETPVTSNTLHCTVQTMLEQRITGYQVVYTYAGKQYQTQLPYDPGPTLALQITPVGAQPPSAAPVVTPPAVVNTVTRTVVVPAPRWVAPLHPGLHPGLHMQPWPLQAGVYIHRDRRLHKYPQERIHPSPRPRHGGRPDHPHR